MGLSKQINSRVLYESPQSIFSVTNAITLAFVLGAGVLLANNGLN